MQSRSVHIEKVLVRDLYEFACARIDRSSNGELIPITRQRAFAWSNNPYADEDDVALLVAYIDDKLVGYQGLMPGMLRGRDGLDKVYWGSTAYVPPEYRKLLVATSLIRKMLSLPYDLVHTGLSHDYERVCKSLRFRSLEPLQYYVLSPERAIKWNPASVPFRLSNKAWLKLTGSRSGSLDRLAKTLDRRAVPYLKKVFYQVVRHSQRKLLARIRWEEVEQFGDREAELLDRRTASVEFNRGVECINWMLRYKWILESVDQKDQELRYAFSHLRDAFRYVPLRLYTHDVGGYLGFVILSVSTQKRNTCLKTLDFGCADPSGYQYVAGVVMHFAALHAADQIILPDCLANYIRTTFPAGLVCSKQTRTCYCRPYDANSPLSVAAPEIVLNYVDGDCAFT